MNIIEINNPLVSIVVSTYNSSKFVLETLKSAKAQTYQNIELIVSDDCSTDDTVEICRRWIDENKDRFVRTELITIEKNTGISANCNRGRKAAKGEWIKGIAGDDVLMEDCIRWNYEHVSKHPEIKLLQSNNLIIDEASNIIGKSNSIHYFYSNEISAKEQHRILLFTYRGNTPTLFIKREFFDNGFMYDEEIRNVEDYQMYLRLTASGEKIYFFDKCTVKYRKNSFSVQRDNEKNTKIVKSFRLNGILLSKKYVLPYVKGVNRLFISYNDYIVKKFVPSKFNKNNFLGRKIWFILYFPYFIYSNLYVKIYVLYKKILKRNK